MNKILLEICTLPFVEKYEDAHSIYEFIMLQKNITFQGNDKALAWIASRKWVHTYEEAIKLYNETTMRYFVHDEDHENIFEYHENIFENTRRKQLSKHL